MNKAGQTMGTIKEGWVGRFFEDFEVGDVYRCRIGRTITETDNIQFTLLTNNTNQIHFNADYASRTEFKKPLVNSAMTLSVVAGLGVADVSENGFALGWDYIKLPNPVFAGDTLYSEFGGHECPRIQIATRPGNCQSAHARNKPEWSRRDRLRAFRDGVEEGSRTPPGAISRNQKQVRR